MLQIFKHSRNTAITSPALLRFKAHLCHQGSSLLTVSSPPGTNIFPCNRIVQNESARLTLSMDIARCHI